MQMNFPLKIRNIQTTSNSSLCSRNWSQIRYCNNNKTSTICNINLKNVCAKCTQKESYVCKKCDKS